jgi:hypothetical protein
MQNIRDTYGIKQVSDAVGAFVHAFSVPHQPSAREQETGHDVAPWIEGKLQFGKIHGKRNNLNLLCEEWKGRFIE